MMELEGNFKLFALVKVVLTTNVLHVVSSTAL